MSIDKNLGPATAYGYAKTKGYTGTEEEYAELMANIAEAVEIVGDKADKDGTYPDMTVGGVMSSDGSTDSTPYLYRVSGGGVEVGTVEEDSIVGGTVAFNQLVQNGNFESDTLWVNEVGTTHSIANGILTLTTGNANNGVRQNGFACVTGHKYVICAESKCDEEKRIAIGTAYAFGVFAEKNIGSEWTAISAVVACKVSSDNTMIYVLGRKTVTNAQVRNFCIFDLTQMFGTSVADYIYSLEQSSTGAGVAFFRKLFPKDYYEYNTGELMSVEGLQSHDMVGFNLFDKTAITENTWIANEHGQIASSNGYHLSDYIRVIPSATYYRNTAGSSRSMYYDADKNVIDTGTWAIGNGTGTFTIPNGVSYIRLTIKDANLNTFCINISSDRNGEYEPYVKHSYHLDSSLTLRGIPKVADGKMYFDGDTYSADGKVVRKYGVITYDGSTDEPWHIQSTGSTIFYIENSDLKKVPNYSGEIICDKLKTTQSSYGYMNDYIITGYNDVNNQYPNQNWIYVRVNSSITEVSALKAWLQANPITLVYELATPTTESAEPYESIQKVSKYGTEEYVSTGIVPVGHVTKYPTDIISKVNGLPSDFSTLIAPTESGFKATRAYSVNQFIIVNNQLYRVTSAIASGATITVGTNVTATTVADILTALLNA